MSVVAIQSHQIWKPFGLATSLLSKVIGSTEDTEVRDQESRARRDFILEMMDAHPEAFQHEMDFQTMMSFYPSRF